MQDPDPVRERRALSPGLGTLAARLSGQLPDGMALAAFATAAAPGGLWDRLGPAGSGLVLAFLILSLAVHEAAHAYVAFLCGDTTARDLGRMTLNPIVHIDPFMTIALPVMMMATTGMIFGGAKPVPVSYHRLRHPLRDMMLVAIAGPLTNYVLAIVFFVVGSLAVNRWGFQQNMLLPMVMNYSGLLNLVLAIFNMIPVPPLDGSRVMAWLLPESLRASYVSLERFGFMIVLVLLMTGVFGVIFSATYPAVYSSVDSIVRLVVS